MPHVPTTHAALPRSTNSTHAGGAQAPSRASSASAPTAGITRRSALARGIGSLSALSGASALLAACGSSGTSGSAANTKGLTAWWWGDPPQMPAWLNQTVAAFKKEAGIGVSVQQQQTTSFVSNFTAATAARQGPGVAAQWATMPVLAQAWKGAITPLNAYVPQSELAHWNLRQENLYQGHYYAMPLYVLGQPWVINRRLFEKAGLDPADPPKTWDALLAVCATLLRKGIQPFAFGNSDTLYGRFALSFLGFQHLDSLDDLKAPMLGEASFADPKYSAFMGQFKELSDRGYLGKEPMSLDVTQAQGQFQSGKAAMAWTSDETALAWGQTLGMDNVVPIKFPVVGAGKLNSAYTATQSCSYFVTSWNSDPASGAEFLKFLHKPEQRQSLFEVCKVVPADNRFDASVITNPLQRELYLRNTRGTQIWLENWIPPSFDDTANGPGAQKLMTGTSVAEVAALWDQQAKAWREENPESAKKYRDWPMTPASV
jgi:raffinose/stachyose/melibiose transport system substrate-binding protein